MSRKSYSKVKMICQAFIILIFITLFSLPALATTYTYDAGGNILNVTALGFDEIPPETKITLEGEAGKESWYRSDVKVTLAATDNEGGSGVQSTEYSYDKTTWTAYSAPFTVSAEGITKVYYRSTDNEGNV